MKFVFHVLGFPHTATSKSEFLHCGYTQKVLNFCKMMHSLGHTVFHYGGEGSDPVCTEHITVVTKAQREEWFKSKWEEGEFSDMQFDASKIYWRKMNARIVIEMGKRIQPRDFICMITGAPQNPIAEAFPDNLSVEYGVGYEGVCRPFRCFESSAWRHHVYGLRQERNGSWYDTVIGNYYDLDDFPMGEGKGDYFLFLGRLIARKNPHIAADVCKRIGAKLIIAGQGVTLRKPSKIYSAELCVEGDHVEHVGVVDVKRRAELLGNARALFVLTQYLGAFEGVHAEAGLCGCPVITTDWGVFPETVEQGITGYRVHTMWEAMYAAQNVHKLDRSLIREKSIKKFSLDSVAKQYHHWFEQLYGLYEGGFYSEFPSLFTDSMGGK
jgi:glycosyltransferase involved in cell wall biosynthesis